MNAPERKVCNPHPVFLKLTSLGSITHFVHKYNIGHKTIEEIVTKNLSECSIKQKKLLIHLFIFPTPNPMQAS